MLCGLFAKTVSQDDAEGLKRRNEIISNLASDLRMQMQAQAGLREV